MVTLARSVVRAKVGVTTEFRHKTGCSQMSTTGSMSAGSNILTVASVMGLRVGDWVIVECGGEAAGGTRGHPGVGGTYPALSYATEAAMNADTSQADRTFAWVEATGDSWWFQASDSTWYRPFAFGPGNDYYRLKVCPKALWAEITEINGSNLTLSKTAYVATTNANVYFDNWGPIYDTINQDAAMVIPAGTYAMSDRLYFASRAGLDIRGSGKTTTTLKTPKGACHGGIFLETCSDANIQDLTIDCAFKNENFGWPFAAESRSVAAGEPINNRRAVETIDGTGGWPAGQGIHIYLSPNAVIRNYKCINPAQHAITTTGSPNTWAYNCTARIEDPIRVYIQWIFQWTDMFTENAGGGCVDCDIDSDWFVPGFNCFKTRDISWIRCTGRNAYFANNGSEGAVLEDMTLVFGAEKSFDEVSAPIDRPCLEFSTNVSGGLNFKAAEVSNLTLIQEGASNTAGRRHISIVVGTTSCPVNFSGTYDTDPVSPKGLVETQAPWVDSNTFDGLGMRINGTVTVEGMRFKGEQPQGWNGSATVPRRMVTNENGNVTLTNSVLDAGFNGTGTYTESGNQTNAEYEA